MNLTVYLAAVAVFLVGITGIIEIKEKKKERVRTQKIKVDSQRRLGHNPRGDFFYDWYEG